MDKKTLIILFILAIILCLFLFFNNDINENFTNDTSYNKYPETLIEKKDGQNINKLYNNYEGELKGKSIWENKTLGQCEKECAELGNCIGFSRDNIDDDMEGNCYPRTNLSVCHTIRKGDSEQKTNASSFNTFIKSNIPKQKTKCLGSNDFTLNRLIYINSYAKPSFYICNDNGNVKLKNYKFNGSAFINQCKFKIVEGLAGEGTISIQMTDNYDENYYLSDNGNGGITILPVRTRKNNKSTLTSRNRASFELVDGFSNSHYISFKTYSLTGNNKYLMVTNETSDNPRLKLVSLKEINGNEKLATFDIVDNITRTSIITSPNNSNKFKNTASIKKEKFEENEIQHGQSLKRITDISPVLELHLEDGTMIPINNSESDIGSILAKQRIENNNLNVKDMSAVERANLKGGNIVRIFINKKNALIGLYSEKNYKSYNNNSNIASYENNLKLLNRSDNNKKMLYKKFKDNEKPNLVMTYGDLFDYNVKRPSGVAFIASDKSNRNLNDGTIIQDDERKLEIGSGHDKIKPSSSESLYPPLNIKSIKIYDDVIKKINKYVPKMNIYNELRGITRDVESIGTSNNIDTYIDKLKKKYNAYKDQRNILTDELFVKQKELNDVINRTKLDKSNLELKSLARNYFFVKGLSDEIMTSK